MIVLVSCLSISEEACAMSCNPTAVRVEVGAITVEMLVVDAVTVAVVMETHISTKDTAFAVEHVLHCHILKIS